MHFRVKPTFSRKFIALFARTSIMNDDLIDSWWNPAAYGIYQLCSDIIFLSVLWPLEWQTGNVQRSFWQTTKKGEKRNDFCFSENVFLLLLKIIKFHYNFLRFFFNFFGLYTKRNSFNRTLSSNKVVNLNTRKAVNCFAVKKVFYVLNLSI